MNLFGWCVSFVWLATAAFNIPPANPALVPILAWTHEHWVVGLLLFLASSFEIGCMIQSLHKKG